MLYQSNLFQNTIGLRHYPRMDKNIFQSQVSFKLEFFSKLNWLFYYLTLTIPFSSDPFWPVILWPVKFGQLFYAN